jgi:hypothetical protein
MNTVVQNNRMLTPVFRAPAWIGNCAVRDLAE